MSSILSYCLSNFDGCGRSAAPPFGTSDSMTRLSSLGEHLNVAIIGASGGIGRSFVEELAADAAVKRTLAFSRSNIDWPAGKVLGHQIDITDETSVAAGAATLTNPLDIVIVASGLLHRDRAVQPEKSLKDLHPAALAEVFAVNALGPALVAKHFLPKLRRKSKTVFAVLSARVGSISDNRLGGWTSYRMSKAALNMFVRTASIEHARNFPESVVVALHPGTVETQLSEPFTRRLDASRLFSASLAAKQLLEVVNDLEPKDSGGFFAYDHSRIEY